MKKKKQKEGIVVIDKLQKLVDELNLTSSSLDKKNTLAKHNDEDVKLLLKYTYSTFIQFHVTSKNLIKKSDLVKPHSLTIVELLDGLHNLDYTGHNAIAMVNGFIAANPDYKDLIHNIIDKNLKARIDSKLINNVFKDLIPVFDVALAEPFEDFKKYVNFKTQKWLASRKLDGCRCIVIHRHDDTTICARSGKEFSTLNKIKEEFDKLSLPLGVYDGEICIVDAEGNEQFSGIMQEIKNKNHTIQKPRYKIFDFISLEDFEKKSGFTLLENRYGKLQSIFSNFQSSYLDLVRQIVIEDEEHFEQLKQEAGEKGWEGLIIRENVGYEGKRSKKMLKVKTFLDGEFKVIGTYPGKKRMFVGGQEQELDCMKGVYVEYENNRVDVGGGWSDEEKLHYHAHPEEIIGKIITVQWFEETSNKKGTHSMRFPTKKWIYGEERDV